MTEQEAIELLQNLNVKLTDMSGHKTNGLEKIFGWNEISAICEAIKALEEIQKYHRIEERLKAVYGECDGLLETFIEQAAENAVSIMESHEGVGIGHPYQSRLLTDEDVDKWEAYKVIGTPDECRAAMEKRKSKKPKEYEDKFYACPVCGNALMHKWEKYPTKLMGKKNGLPYCLGCGQELDWSDEEC